MSMIDKQKAIDTIQDKYCAAYCGEESFYQHNQCNGCEIGHCIETLQEMQEVPVKNGRWLQYSRNTEETYIECSECCVASRPRQLQMVTRTGSGLPDYCPNCGAKMDGGADNDSE